MQRSDDIIFAKVNATFEFAKVIATAWLHLTWQMTVI